MFLPEQVMETSLLNPEIMKEGPKKSDFLPIDLTIPETGLFMVTLHTAPVRVTFTNVFSHTAGTSLFRATHHTAPVRVTFTPFLSPPAALPQSGFNHLPFGTHVFCPSFLLLNLGPLRGTTHFTLKREAGRSSKTLMSHHSTV
jgi:hypothetical protein